MTDERMKELMQQVGYPNSNTIAQLILQVENETAQEWEQKTAEKCRVIALKEQSIYGGNGYNEACNDISREIKAHFKL